VTSLDWAQIGSVALIAAVVSLLTSLASDRIGDPGPSLVGESAQPAEPVPVVAFPVAVDDDELARRQNNDVA
jgi:hypothetical protein